MLLNENEIYHFHHQIQKLIVEETCARAILNSIERRMNKNDCGVNTLISPKAKEMARNRYIVKYLTVEWQLNGS